MPKKEAKSKKEIESTLAGIEKTFGKGSAMLMKDDVQDYEEGIIPTGSIILDMALGIGGLPKGRIVEIFGAESAGKTTLQTAEDPLLALFCASLSVVLCLSSCSAMQGCTSSALFQA